MPEQATQEGDAVLKHAIQQAEIRRIHLRGIEMRIQNQIEDLGASCLTPKTGKKIATLKAAQALVTKVKSEVEEEQKMLETEIGEEPQDE